MGSATHRSGSNRQIFGLQGQVLYGLVFSCRLSFNQRSKLSGRKRMHGAHHEKLLGILRQEGYLLSISVRLFHKQNKTISKINLKRIKDSVAQSLFENTPCIPLLRKPCRHALSLYFIDFSAKADRLQ